jgi:hypothetical protein
MRQESTPPVPGDRLGTIWRTDSVPISPRPWLWATLTLTCIALAIAGSLGPWLYVERGPEWAIEVERLPGTANDGVFSLFFALIATVALVIALVRPRLWVLAVVAFVAMAFCSLVGLFDWVIFDPMDLAYLPGQSASLIRVEWGLKLLTFAAPAGAVCAFLFARALMKGDY